MEMEKENLSVIHLHTCVTMSVRFGLIKQFIIVRPQEDGGLVEHHT